VDFDYLRQEDPDIMSAVTAEFERERWTLELIASENFVSPAVLEAAGSTMTNKYAEGYPENGITVVVRLWIRLKTSPGTE